MDMISNYKNLVPNLERQELESSLHGSTSPQVYGQLLAIYLLINDLYDLTISIFVHLIFIILFYTFFRPNAKLLWKRIPTDVKEANSDIQAVWKVGVKLFNQRDLPDIYEVVDQYEWPGHLKNIMNSIKCN